MIDQERAVAPLVLVLAWAAVGTAVAVWILSLPSTPDGAVVFPSAAQTLVPDGSAAVECGCLIVAGALTWDRFRLRGSRSAGVVLASLFVLGVACDLLPLLADWDRFRVGLNLIHAPIGAALAWLLLRPRANRVSEQATRVR